jgi:hypothetical protein
MNGGPQRTEDLTCRMCSENPIETPWSHLEDRTFTKDRHDFGFRVKDWWKRQTQVGGVSREAGLHQAAHILEKYGIGSETDVSELYQDYFSNLALKSLDSKTAQALV